MNAERYNGSLFAAAITLLIIALISLLMVGERALAALWQWYAFYGYETSGIITLSKKTGVFFAAFMGALTLACLAVKRAGERSDPRVAKLSRAALALVFIGVVTYCGLAFSPLNMWRS